MQNCVGYELKKQSKGFSENLFELSPMEQTGIMTLTISSPALETLTDSNFLNLFMNTCICFSSRN